jgi:hypothetical protein
MLAFRRMRVRRRGVRSDDADRPLHEAPPQHPLLEAVVFGTAVCLCRATGEFSTYGTTQQQNTHIGEPRDLYYPWHPWHDRKVRVHATLVKRGFAVARCSLEDVHPFRILEVPLWMFDAAACCKIRTAGSSVATVESLRELQAVLGSTQGSDLDLAIQAQHRYLLDTGGADVSVVEPSEIYSTGVVCSAASETELARTGSRDATESSALADPTAAAGRKIGRRSGNRGGAR